MNDTETNETDTQAELKQELVQDVLAELRAQETSILKRNTAINLRYNNLYGSGLTDGLPVKRNFDDTQFNFIRLVPEIMTNQLFGRGFQVQTTYHKKDLSVYDLPAADPATQNDQKQEKDQAKNENALSKTNSDIRAEAIRAINLDNGGLSFFNRAGKMGSYSGVSIIKHWLDKDEKKYKMVLLENPNNFWRAWSRSNFREWDWSAYIDQISLNSANRQYGKFLGTDETFETAKQGSSVWEKASGEDVNNMPGKNVWVIDLTGYIPGYGYKNGQLAEVKPGDEDELNVIIVGNKVVSVTNKNIAQFEVINNLEEPMEPWGVSDISEDAISINRTIIQLARSWTTLAIKSLFYKLKFKGFTAVNIPQQMDMEVQGLPMDVDQDVELLQQPQTYDEFQRIIEWLIQSFVRVTRIGMVMFNDPSAVGNSNQAMITGMKPLTDVIEEKQARWNIGLTNIYTTALNALADADFDDAIKTAVTTDPTWKVVIEWPSVLRKEDAAWQTLWLNLKNAGQISWSTFIEKVGPQNASDELDRIRDDMADPVRAAMMGGPGTVGTLANHTINSSLGIPPWGYVTPKVTLRGDLTPEQEANMAENYDWNSGPYGSSIGPQGYLGTQANDNFINQGQFLGQDPKDAQLLPAGSHPQPGAHPQAPQLTADQNTGPQPMSQPGSGATPVGAQGAINKTNQNAGK